MALTVGIFSVGGIALLRRIAPWFPGSLLVISTASAAVALLTLPIDTIYSQFGSLPAGLPAPSPPHVSIAQISALLPSAFVIAFLAAVESLLSAVVADRMIGGRHRSNAELLAQGAANIVSPLFGGLPATGAIARTATNVRAGGRTPVAGIVHSAVILLITLGAGWLTGYLAMPALAALLIVTAWVMSEPHRWGERMRLKAGDRVLLFLTMALTLLTDLAIAIAVGTVAAWHFASSARTLNLQSGHLRIGPSSRGYCPASTYSGYKRIVCFRPIADIGQLTQSVSMKRTANWSPRRPEGHSRRSHPSPQIGFTLARMTKHIGCVRKFFK